MDGTGLHHLRVLRRESHPSQVRPHLSAPSVSEQSGGAKSRRRGKPEDPSTAGRVAAPSPTP